MCVQVKTRGWKYKYRTHARQNLANQRAIQHNEVVEPTSATLIHRLASEPWVFKSHRNENLQSGFLFVYRFVSWGNIDVASNPHVFSM
jgi:hypothetical protein